MMSQTVNKKNCDCGKAGIDAAECVEIKQPEVQCGRERGDEIWGEKHITSNYNRWVCPRAKDEGICGKK